MANENRVCYVDSIIHINVGLLSGWVGKQSAENIGMLLMKNFLGGYDES
jgi:hypothetical protein